MATVIHQILDIQNHFDNDKVHIFTEKYWNMSFLISLAYVISVFALKWWMVNRERYDLRKPLFLWSTLLALFSLYGFWMNGFYHFWYLWTYGWKSSVCDRTMIEGARGLWTFLFCFSKAPELVDTYFIVLRKQKLIFLHWYHHITVFVYCWFHYSRQIHAAQWFVSMNYLVHSIMYTYYAIRASGRYRPPVWVNMFITFLQLLQMVMGVYINIYIYYNMKMDAEWYCDGNVETTYLYVYWSFAMYFSYFVLFASFFYNAYFKKLGKTRQIVDGDSRTVTSNGSSPCMNYRNGTQAGDIDHQNGTQACGIDYRNETHDGIIDYRNGTKAGGSDTSLNGLHRRTRKMDNNANSASDTL